MISCGSILLDLSMAPADHLGPNPQFPAL